MGPPYFTKEKFLIIDVVKILQFWKIIKIWKAVAKILLIKILKESENKMRRRKFLGIGLAMLLALGLILTGCGGNSTEQSSGSAPAEEKEKPIEITFAHFDPADSALDIHIAQKFANELSAATNGKVKLVIYPSGTLVPIDKILDGVLSGACDIGFFPTAWAVGRLPYTFMFEQAGIGFNSGKAASLAFDEAMRTFAADEYKDVHPLCFFCSGPGIIITKEKINSLNDIRGMQIRSNATNAEAIKAWGGTPVTMNTSEVYEALRQGIIDGFLGVADPVASLKFYEVTNYVTKNDMFNSGYVICMNKDKYNSLPADIQKAIDDVSQKLWKESFINYYDTRHAEAMKVITSKATEYEIPADVYQQMVDKASVLVDKYAAELDSNGLKGTEEAKLLRELVNKYNNQ